MRQERGQSGRGQSGALLFTLLLLALALTLLLRWRQSPAEAEVSAAPTAAPTATPLLFAVETPPRPSPTPTPRTGPYVAQGYTAETYQLVSDLVYTRRREGAAGEETVQSLLASLREADPPLGEAWAGIMDCWKWVNDGMTILSGQVPQGLPEDGSLCFVVLGFQLQYDGSMAPQLLGRCEAALACARRYPNSLLALTGGGTAAGDKSKTEAGVMADWLVSQGVRRERLIVEDESMTTDQNARNTTAILVRDYPQITTLAVVTSDYHVPLGVLMFTEAALLRGCETGSAPFTVAANMAYPTNATEADWDFWGEKNQGGYVWTLANPRY